MDSIQITSGPAGGSQQDLEESIGVVEAKIKRDAREIVNTMKADFPRFLERQARELYTSAASGFKLDAEALARVKASLAEAGERAVGEIIPELEDWSLWVETDTAIPPEGERRDLRANPRVHQAIQKIGGYLEEVLESYGFPGLEKLDFSDMYRLPTWFISGRLLISLVESYWRNLSELRALRTTLESLKEDEGKRERGAEWDAA